MTVRRAGRDPRRAALGRVHIVAKQLKLDDDTYRALLERITGKRSAAELNASQLHDVLVELDRLTGDGDRGVRASALPDAPKRVRTELRAMIGKISALLSARNLDWAYAHGLAQRMFNTQRVEWLRADQLHSIVAALAYDQRRRKLRKGEGS